MLCASGPWVPQLVGVQPVHGWIGCLRHWAMQGIVCWLLRGARWSVVRGCFEWTRCRRPNGYCFSVLGCITVAVRRQLVARSALMRFGRQQACSDVAAYCPNNPRVDSFTVPVFFHVFMLCHHRGRRVAAEEAMVFVRTVATLHKAGPCNKPQRVLGYRIRTSCLTLCPKRSCSLQTANWTSAIAQSAGAP